MSIRLKTGKLKQAEVKRRTSANEPNTFMILDTTRVKKLNKEGERVRSKSAVAVSLHVKTDLAYQIDMKYFVYMASVALMDHYSWSLLNGKRADGKGDLPDLRPKSKDGTYGSRDGEFGNKTGFMAENWVRLNIGGNSFKASTKVKPNGYGGRSFQINGWGKRKDNPVDLQSVEGAAAEAMRRGLQHALEMSVTDQRGMIGKPRDFDVGTCLLPNLVQ